MSEEALISVIMPVYNQAQYLPAAVESVLAQRRTDWALWIVDDGSTDASPGIADGLASRDRRIHVVHQANAGPGAARNAAVPQCRSAWLAFLDSDDLYYPTALQDFGDFIAAHADATFIYGWRNRLNQDGTVVELPGEHQDRVTGAGELFERMYLSHLCVCYRRELFPKAGGYDVRLPGAEDYDLYLRMSALTKFHPLGKATGLRRRHRANRSRQTGYSRMVQAAVLRRYLEKFGGKDVVAPEAAARRLGRVYYSAGRQYFKDRCFQQSGEAFALARSYKPSLKASLLSVAARVLRPLGRRDGRELPSL